MKKSIHIIIPEHKRRILKFYSVVKGKDISELFRDYVAEMDINNCSFDKNKVISEFSDSGHRLHIRVEAEYLDKMYSMTGKNKIIISRQKKIGPSMIRGFLFLRYLNLI